MDDDDADDDKFKESSDGSDDDIFGSGSEKGSKKSQEEDKGEEQLEETNFGQIKCAKGEFSMFALSQGNSEDEPLWSFATQDGQKIFSKITSKEMDRNYTNTHCTEYPMVSFDPSSNNYIPYALFHATPDITFFRTFSYTHNNTNSNNYRRKKTNQGQNSYQQDQGGRQRKLSEQEFVSGPPKNRKLSNNYKPKQSHI